MLLICKGIAGAAGCTDVGPARSKVAASPRDGLMAPSGFLSFVFVEVRNTGLFRQDFTGELQKREKDLEIFQVDVSFS